MHYALCFSYDVYQRATEIFGRITQICLLFLFFFLPELLFFFLKTQFVGAALRDHRKCFTKPCRLHVALSNRRWLPLTRPVTSWQWRTLVIASVRLPENWPCNLMLSFSNYTLFTCCVFASTEIIFKKTCYFSTLLNRLEMFKLIGFWYLSQSFSFISAELEIKYSTKSVGKFSIWSKTCFKLTSFLSLFTSFASFQLK